MFRRGSVNLLVDWIMSVERAGLEPAPTEVVSDESGLFEGLDTDIIYVIW
jgi:hypothetical protein